MTRTWSAETKPGADENFNCALLRVIRSFNYQRKNLWQNLIALTIEFSEE
jgi:hypothetical protein